MATLWITFRLHDGSVGGRDYKTRYDALVEAVKTHRATVWWYEPTSFWLIDSTSTHAQVAASAKRAIAPGHDLVLVGSMDVKGATLAGTASNLADLKKLIPGLGIA